jgi:hypothetical protein
VSKYPVCVSDIGLPPSPPSQAPYYASSNTPPPGDGGAADHPFGVVVKKKGHGGSYKIAIIVLASAMATVICVGVLGFMVMRWRGSTAPIEPVLAASATQRSACSGIASFGKTAEFSI